MGRFELNGHREFLIVVKTFCENEKKERNEGSEVILAPPQSVQNDVTLFVKINMDLLDTINKHKNQSNYIRKKYVLFCDLSDELKEYHRKKEENKGSRPSWVKESEKLSSILEREYSSTKINQDQERKSEYYQLLKKPLLLRYDHVDKDKH